MVIDALDLDHMPDVKQSNLLSHMMMTGDLEKKRNAALSTGAGETESAWNRLTGSHISV